MRESKRDVISVWSPPRVTICRQMNGGVGDQYLTMGSRDGRASVMGNDLDSTGRKLRILGSMSSGDSVPVQRDSEHAFGDGCYRT